MKLDDYKVSELAESLRNLGPLNHAQKYKVGDAVEYSIYTIDPNKISETKVKSEILKDNLNGTYDIKNVVPPCDVEKEVDGKYLFPSTN